MAEENKNSTIHVSEEIEDAFLQGEKIIDPLRPDKNSEDESEDEQGFSLGFFKWIVVVVIFSVFVFSLFNFFVKTYVVSGLSMFPTFNDGDRLVLLAAGKSWANFTGQEYLPKRGDVIVLLEPKSETEQYIKRVVGLPGERVVLDNYQFTIFNDTYPDGFNPDPGFDATLRPTDGQVDVIVPENHVFVVGDNRESGGSYDSRNGLGMVDVDLIQGKAWIRFLPVSEFRVF